MRWIGVRQGKRRHLRRRSHDERSGSARRRKCITELLMEAADLLEAQRASGAQLRVELPRPKDIGTTSREGASDERPVSLDEAEHTVDYGGVPHHATHNVNLFQ